MVDVNTGTAGTLRIVASEASVDVAANTSQVAWALYLLERVPQTSFNLVGTGATVTVDGSGVFSGSFTFDWRPAGLQTTLIASGTTTVTHDSDGSKTVAVVGHIDSTGTTGAGGPTDVTQNLTLTTLLLPPDAPTSVTVTRVSDTQHTVGWTVNPGTRKPYTSQNVQRYDNVTGAWATIATGLPGAATSYSDTTTVANRSYQYRIVAINSGGSATSSASSAVQTTPAAPTAASAAKSGSDIAVQWTNNHSAGMTVAYEVYASQDGGAYSLLATTAAGATSYTHTSPDPGSTWQYKVRAKSTAGSTLYSDYATTGVVQLLTAPNAPTGLGPTTPADASEDRTLSWTHNPVDTTPQRKFQIRHRASGGSWTTEPEVTSATSEWVLAGGTYANGTTVEWEVRTWGEATSGGSDGTGASAYSATASFVTSARPTVTISAPADAGTLTDSTIAVAWTYYQAAASPQAQWRVTLLDDAANVLEVQSGSGDTATVTMATPAADGKTYTVQVEVASTAGLWSLADTATFDVSYLPPSEVEAALAWDRDSGTVQLTLTRAPWDDIATIEPVAATIDRSVDAGATWTRVATDVALSDTTVVVDTTVPTVADVLYRVTATSALPSTFVGTPVAISINETARAYLGYGPSFATILVFYGNLALNSRAERDEVVEQFAGRVGSDNQPAGVLISGEARSRSVGVSARYINADGFATRDDFEKAALAGGVMCYRDPSGRRMFGRLSNLSTNESVDIFGDVTFAITEATSA